MPADLAPQNQTTYPLLSTRFFLPALPTASVLRPRLMKRMNQALRVPPTLISALPGFGKSTLTSQWVHQAADMKAGWMSLFIRSLAN